MLADSVLNKRNSFKNLSKADKDNLVYTANSLIAVGLIGAIGKAVVSAFEDDEDAQNLFEYAFSRMIDDAMVALTLGPIWGIADDPFIFLSYFKRIWNTTGKAITNAAEGDLDQSWEQIQSVTPIVKNFQY
jgi:hypothetical protein